MPFVERPSASLTFGLLDETGSRSTISFDVPEGTLADAALTAANAVRLLLANVTGCAIISQSVTYSQFDTTPELPVAGSRVEKKGVMIFRTAAGKTARYEIPGIDSGLVLSSGRINEDSPAMAALITAITEASALFCDSNGSDLVSLKETYERYRRTTRGMMPRDRAPDADVLP